MDTNYLILIIAVVAIVAIVLLLRRGRTRAIPGTTDEPAAVSTFAAAGMIDPVIAVPPQALDAVPLTVPVADGPPDPLTTIKGLGPRAAAQLNALGITRYDQLAALSGATLDAIDAQMGTFRGRIARDRWVEQAGHLAAGDTAGFEAKFGKLGG